LDAVPPPRLLSAAETARCAELRFERRRRDWLLGRWTAKHLVQAYLAGVAGESCGLVDLLIVAAADGAPEVEMHNAQWTMHNDSSQPALVSVRPETAPVYSTDAGLSLSISHSRDTSMCAVMDADAGVVGADLEWIEHREPGFVAQFFTPDEMALVEACGPDFRDTLITAIWSGKEAVLKALRMGLRADTRSVSVVPRPEVAISPPLTPQPWGELARTSPSIGGRGAEYQPDPSSPPPRWLRMDVQVSQELVDPTASSFSKFEGWWQVYEGFVLAIVTRG